MKRIIVIIFAILPIFAFAQTETLTSLQPEIPKHEVGFSVGACPLITFVSGWQWGWPTMIHYRNYDDDYEYLIGSFNLHYMFNISKLHSVGFNTSLAFQHEYIDEYDYYNRNLDLNNTYLTIEAQYRITFKRFEKCSLYSGISLGFTLVFLDDFYSGKDAGWFGDNAIYKSPVMYPDFHLTALGVSLGKRNNCNLELGIGTQGIFKVGYCYKL